MLGLIEDAARAVPMAFQREGDAVLLIGADDVRGDAAPLAGSEYLKLQHDGLIAGRPGIDLDLEVGVQRVVLAVARAGLLASAHDCSRGGLAVALAECCMAGGLGLDAAGLAIEGRRDAALFGEAPSRVVVSAADGTAIERLAREQGVPVARLGAVSGARLRIADEIDAAVEELRAAYEGGLPAALGA
jgi:phosphoribosylformylglycinamidine synthase